MHCTCCFNSIVLFSGRPKSNNSEISHLFNWFQCMRFKQISIVQQIFICHNEFKVHLCHLARAYSDSPNLAVEWFPIRFTMHAQQCQTDILFVNKYAEIIFLIWHDGVTFLFLPHRQRNHLLQLQCSCSIYFDRHRTNFSSSKYKSGFTMRYLVIDRKKWKDIVNKCKSSILLNVQLK